MRRPAIRPPRGTKRTRPRVIKGLMRVAVGSTILYLAAGTNNVYKLSRGDVEVLETDTRKQIEEMTEEEKKNLMDNLSSTELSWSLILSNEVIN